MNNLVAKIFMAFAKGKEVTSQSQSVAFDKYIGVTPVKVVAVNPNKAWLDEYYGREVEAPQYVSEVEKDNAKYQRVRIDFFVETLEEYAGVTIKSKLTYFLTNKVNTNRDKTKAQIIDKYGNTAWFTTEDIKAKKVPADKVNSISSDYRPAYIGEEALIKFLRTYLGLKPVIEYINGAWFFKKEENNFSLEDNESKIEDMQALFKGDIREIEEVIAYQPNNLVNVMFGVRTADDNRQYQVTYPELVLPLNAREASFEKLKKNLDERKAMGGYSNTEFSTGEFKKYEVESTSFTEPVANDSELPWI
jgi:hypothetical protein